MNCSVAHLQGLSYQELLTRLPIRLQGWVGSFLVKDFRPPSPPSKMFEIKISIVLHRTVVCYVVGLQKIEK